MDEAPGCYIGGLIPHFTGFSLNASNASLSSQVDRAMERNGKIVAQGAARRVMGNPLNAVA